MKKLKLPLGKIAAVGLAATGVATSVLIDNVLKKEMDTPETIKDAGRIGASLAVNSMFIGLAAAAWNDKQMNFEIPLGTEGPRSKDIKRFGEALDLWESIVSGVETGKARPEQDEMYEVYKDNIHEFNKVMKKLAKRIGFKYNEIDYKAENLYTVVLNYVDEVNSILEGIKTNYIHIVSLENKDEAESLDSEKSNMSDDQDEIKEKESVITVDVAKKLLSSFGDVTVTEECLDELLKNDNDPTISDIVNKYIEEEITVTEAKERLIAYLHSIVDEDESEDNESSAETTEEA